MHIEAGIVQGTKMILSYGTAIASFGIVAKLALDSIKKSNLLALIVKSLIATIFVFMFFQVFPHTPVGISELHLILGSTLFLVFGVVPTAIGLALGLLIQGVFFAPFDIPQYGANVTTLLMPLFAMAYISKRVIPENIAYKDIKYSQALKLSMTYQAGIVSWVAFWAFYGSGFSVETLSSVGSFGVAYLAVIIIEPFVDLAVLAGAKKLSNLKDSRLIEQRLYN